MTSIERTAYPRLNAAQIISQKTLEDNYALDRLECEHINNITRTTKLRLLYALQLKTFQTLGYFIDLEHVPQVIIAHMRKQLVIPHNIPVPSIKTTTLYRHRQSIRQYLEWTPWEEPELKAARRFAIKIAYQAAQTLNLPTDIINMVIEELKTNRFELPAFSTLCRLVRHVRARVNRAIFLRTFSLLTEAQIIPTLAELLIVPGGQLHSPYQALKQQPKSPRIGDFKDLIRHHSWIATLGNMTSCLQGITKQKYLQFVREAKALDVSNLMDISEARRYTLVACLVDYAQRSAKDNLAEVLCKTISVTHKRARAELITIRERAAGQTQEIALFVSSILGTFSDNAEDPQAFFDSFSATIKYKGGIDNLSQACDRIMACYSNQHYPLLWTYFKPRRVALFDVIDTIKLGASTHNNHLISALTFLQSSRHKRAEILEAPEDLSLNFIADVWRPLVYAGKPEDKKLNRRLFEMCIFTYLSYELISGDVFIEGADSFSDYRISLLSLRECQDILLQEQQASSLLPTKGEDFIRDLKHDLTQKAKAFDAIYPNLADFVIDAHGVGSLKKIPTTKPTAKTLELVAQIQQNMPERSLLDILCSTHHTTGWAFNSAPSLDLKPALPSQ